MNTDLSRCWNFFTQEIKHRSKFFRAAARKSLADSRVITGKGQATESGAYYPENYACNPVASNSTNQDAENSSPNPHRIIQHTGHPPAESDKEHMFYTCILLVCQLLAVMAVWCDVGSFPVNLVLK
jgi:hypothetical protein